MPLPRRGGAGRVPGPWPGGPGRAAGNRAGPPVPLSRRRAVRLFHSALTRLSQRRAPASQRAKQNPPPHAPSRASFLSLSHSGRPPQQHPHVPREPLPASPAGTARCQARRRDTDPGTLRRGEGSDGGRKQHGKLTGFLSSCLRSPCRLQPQLRRPAGRASSAGSGAARGGGGRVERRGPAHRLLPPASPLSRSRLASGGV